MLDSLAREHALEGADPAAMAERMDQYLRELLAWTRDSNLVAQSDLGRLASRHVAESLAVLPLLDAARPLRLVDVGSGGGFPAIPIAILRPGIEVILIESRRRKGLFLLRVAEALGLTNVRVRVERVEHLAADWQTLADLGTARAVAGIQTLLRWLAPLVRPGGRAILFKGSSYESELAAWAAAADPLWIHRGVRSDPARHLHFLEFERTVAPIPAADENP